jgi:gamma-glutamylcyclotransferase (GGCT)/AIG2-like uncharacterized protein YtfP
MNDDSAGRHRLVTYGTLAPGPPNHHQLDGLDGDSTTGWIHGHLKNEGWGADLGYPALVLDPEGATVDVDISHSEDLSMHWARLDDFEGPGYERILTTVQTADGPVEGYIYAHRPPDD